MAMVLYITGICYLDFTHRPYVFKTTTIQGVVLPSFSGEIKKHKGDE
jgi:hypothetical protein